MQQGPVPTLCKEKDEQPYTPHCTMEVNGIKATDIRDTGADIIIIVSAREENLTGTTAFPTQSPLSTCDLLSSGVEWKWWP